MFLVFATINPEAGYRGITALVVERGCAGFTVGKKEDKLGIRASSTCELIFDDCRVPKANVLGEVGKGYKSAIETLNEGRIASGAQMIGLAAGALDHAIRYNEGAKPFGKGELARVPGSAASARARRGRGRGSARLTVYNAARLATRAAVSHRSGDLQDFLIGSRRARGIARGESFGGNGFVKEYPVEKLYRDAKIGQIYEGTSNLQLQTIAKQLLG